MPARADPAASTRTTKGSVPGTDPVAGACCEDFFPYEEQWGWWAGSGSGLDGDPVGPGQLVGIGVDVAEDQ